ncbi:5-oxoprolinase subunit PxpA [Tautonia rosea]|uniref:5-oxoprolinase subunit PxpA n=1 Tax=Tautonia rosea TaxID=2728037 RepID=UPI0014731BB3|nr:5-oxoprolinase subunit PxpA [Tautonia rosea]
MIDLNADLGEGFPDDEALLDRISSACISCGGHAGGRSVCLETIEIATRKRVVIGAHPGYPDREGFGRRERIVSAREVTQMIEDQLSQFDAWAAEIGAITRFVKPHGALYNQAQRSWEIAEGVVMAVLNRRLPVLGLPGSVLEREVLRAGLMFVPEGFADRRYRPDGTLVPRSESGALIDDPTEAERQALLLIDRGLRTLCLHGDDPSALAKADRLRAAFVRDRIEVRSFVGESRA